MFNQFYPKGPKDVVIIDAPPHAKKPAQQKRGNINNAGHNRNYQNIANMHIFPLMPNLQMVITTIK
jgi:hypothetical protein